MDQAGKPQTGLVVIEETKPEKRGPTFKEILASLSEIDEGMVEVELSEHLNLMEDGRRKVDNIKEFKDFLRQRAEHHAMRKKEHADAERALKNMEKKLDQGVVFAMQSEDFKKFSGYEYKVAISRSKPSVELKIDAKPELILEFSDFIRTKYEWDKIKIYDALVAGNEKASEIAFLRENIYPKFTVNKGID